MASSQRGTATLADLPLALLQSVLALLPADARARACVVQKSWNAALAERRMWLRLDLSPASSVAVATDATLRAAAARAGGQLQALDVSGCERVSLEALLAVARANAATLRELRALEFRSDGEGRRDFLFLTFTEVQALLEAAPQLHVLEADVFTCARNAEPLLRNQAPFAPLRIRNLGMNAFDQEHVRVRAVVSSLCEHVSVKDVQLLQTPLGTPATLDAFVDVALAQRLSGVTLDECGLSTASVPALSRLIGGDALTRLAVCCTVAPLLDVPAAAMLGTALRASTTLSWLRLSDVGVWQDPGAANVLLAALTGHSSLRTLALNNVEGGWFIYPLSAASQTVISDALGALVAADSSALQELDLRSSLLGDNGLGPLVDALPRNTHLRTLHCQRNGIRRRSCARGCCRQCAPTPRCVCSRLLTTTTQIHITRNSRFRECASWKTWSRRALRQPMRRSLGGATRPASQACWLRIRSCLPAGVHHCSCSVICRSAPARCLQASSWQPRARTASQRLICDVWMYKMCWPLRHSSHVSSALVVSALVAPLSAPLCTPQAASRRELSAVAPELCCTRRACPLLLGVQALGRRAAAACVRACLLTRMC
jgi:hypothetical protein